MDHRSSMKDTTCLRRATWLFALLFVAHLPCRAADLVFVDTRAQKSSAQQPIMTAANFYGVDTHVVLVSSNGELSAVIKAIQNPITTAVVLTADVLPFVNRQHLLAALRSRKSASIPLLIAGIDRQTDPELLK